MLTRQEARVRSTEAELARKLRRSSSTARSPHRHLGTTYPPHRPPYLLPQLVKLRLHTPHSKPTFIADKLRDHNVKLYATIVLYFNFYSFFASNI